MIGQMRDKIVIKQPVDTIYPGGGAVSEYVPVISELVKVVPLSSSRLLQDNQVNINEGFTFELRYRASYTPYKTHVVEYEGKEYTINSIREKKERKRFWVITAINDGQPATT